MIDLTREALAYTLIAAAAVVCAPWLAMTLRRRQRRRLRLRGIKRYGH